MSIQSAPYFWVVCDCCGARADYGEFAAWSDEGQARDYSESGFERVDGLDLCAACWIWPEDMPDYDEAKWQGSDDPVRRHAAHPEPSEPRLRGDLYPLVPTADVLGHLSPQPSDPSLRYHEMTPEQVIAEAEREEREEFYGYPNGSGA